ncbi:DUF5677 domain-containing protein [Candidatus Latescibacterota bacterium]
MNDDISVPLPPEITDDQLAHCQETDDFCPILFEWYKYVGLLCNYYASISSDSPAVRKLPPLHYALLVGLLNRCSRLILANVALSHKGLFGETTSILDRCIFESVIKTIWLCKTHDKDRFIRFIADGLKTEIEFKNQIEKIISEHDGSALAIESRMIESINKYISSSGLSEQEISGSKKLPDLASMIQSVGSDRLLYIIGYKIGSHHVHGTWPSLRFSYLTKHDGLLIPRDHDCSTHVNQYVFVPILVLQAVRAFVEFICTQSVLAEKLSILLNAVEDKVMKLNEQIVGKDFNRIEF